MNALITDSNLPTAAENLDRSRCFNQAKECKQMLIGLYSLNNSDYYQNLSNRCSVCCWKGWEHLLACFGHACLIFSATQYNYSIPGDIRRFLDNLSPLPWVDYGRFLPWWIQPDSEWLTHQRRLLISKDPDHYGALWPDLDPDPVRYYPVANSPGTFETRDN